MFRRLLLIFVYLLISATAFAGDLAKPAGDTILAVDGQISVTNDGNKARFDRKMLEGLPRHTVETSTDFTKGVIRFEGFLLSDLMKLVGAEGSVIHAVALNDYSADIPMSDLSTKTVLVAYSADGEPISIRDKGPLWIIYPKQSETEVGADNHKMVWQLNRLTVN